MPNLSTTVTFLFAGDGSLASDGLSVFLQTKSNFLMVSECSDGAQAVAALKSGLPDIAVIDAHLPDMSAEEIVRAVREINQDTKLIILGASADRAIADHLLAAGADAYIVRSGPSRHLNDAIRCVCDGGKYLATELTREAPVSSAAHPPAAHSSEVAGLQEALEAQGRTVERLEKAMGRAQSAIELLQQRVEQLSGFPLEAPPAPEVPDDGGRHRMMPGLRSKLGAVAAAIMVGAMGFLLAGVLRPAPAPHFVELATLGTEDSLRPTSTPGLNLENWETDTIVNAAALLRSQKYAAAENLCRNLLKQDPANTAALRVLASALYHQDRIEESADVVRSMGVQRASTTHPPIYPDSFNR